MFVYTVTNRVDGKVYVGKTIQSPSKRWRAHQKDSLRPKYPLHRAIKKYGSSNFLFQVIAQAFTETGLNEMEMCVIRQFDSMNRARGCNLTEGGEGVRPCEETRRKMSLALVGNKRMLGKKQTAATRALIAEANSRRVWKDSSKQKLGQSRKTCPTYKTQEFKDKMRTLFLARQRDSQGRLLTCQH